MRARASAVLIAIMGWGVTGQSRVADVGKYLPKKALACEMGSTPNSARYCKNCNEWATIGASERVTIQAGGCGKSLQKVAEFTPEGAEFFQPIEATHLTVATLDVTGTSTHAGLETFNAGIATNTVKPATGTSMAIGDVSTTVTIPGNLITDRIISTTPATKSVNIPGSNDKSLQIGPSGKYRGIR